MFNITIALKEDNNIGISDCKSCGVESNDSSSIITIAVTKSDDKKIDIIMTEPSNLLYIMKEEI